jgi:hypothetical protein
LRQVFTTLRNKSPQISLKRRKRRFRRAAQADLLHRKIEKSRDGLAKLWANA